METIWQTFLFRLAEHAQVVVPLLLATGILGLGPIGRAIARRLNAPDAERGEIESLSQQVAELQERMDYTERQLGTLRKDSPPEAEARLQAPRAPDSRRVTPV